MRNKYRKAIEGRIAGMINKKPEVRSGAGREGERERKKNGSDERKVRLRVCENNRKIKDKRR